MNLSRRTFLQTAAGAVALGTMNANALFAADFPAYENRLQDRLWMWGHDSGAYDGPNGVYNIPLSEPISMPDAIRYMGIPNVSVIRGGTPGPEYRKPFESVRRITWNLSSGSNASYQSLRDYAFGLLDEMPNLIGFDLDDFFHGGPDQKETYDGREYTCRPAALSLAELDALRERARGYRRRVELRAVLYSAQLTPSIAPAMEFVDTVALWTWSGPHVMKLAENFHVYREILPKKPTLLGIYMWDFGNKKPMEPEFMEHQLAVALDLFKKGEIEGMTFHCTPLCNKNLPAVEFSRQWIQKHRDETR
ncbi:MAG: hypothetical protein Q4D98_14810 [Planctomycetia bacterium]|nr:hypothetical protein [Planctomycetia bacterium]